jgi:glycosyltransferase involved in cell wall biosynthesis
VHNLFPPFEEQKNALLRTCWHVIDDWGRADSSVGDILASFKPDVLQSNTINGVTADVWQIAKRAHIPVVHTLHDYYLLCPRCSRFKNGTSCAETCRSCSLLSIRRRQRASLVDAVVGVSRRTLDIHLQNGVFVDTKLKYVVSNVPNPAIVFTPQPAPEGPLRLGYLGRFSEEKGVRLLAEAINLVPMGLVRLKLAGNVSDEERAVLRALAPQAELEFVGFVNPAEFYATVDLVAMPSIWEDPSPLAFVDALAAGRPVLTTGYGGIGEMIVDGVNGWIAQPQAQSFADRLQALAADRQAIIDAHDQLARAKNTRNLSSIAGEYRQIFKDVSRQ